MKVRFSLSRKSDDDVRGKIDLRYRSADAIQQPAVLLAGVSPVHSLEDCVGPGLERQVKISRNPIVGCQRLDQPIVEIPGMRGDVADSLQARGASHRIQQVREIRVRGRTAVGVNGLAEKLHLFETAGDEVANLVEHILKRPADLPTAGVRHDAEGAELAATLDHGHHSPRSALAKNGVEVVLVFDVETSQNRAATLIQSSYGLPYPSYLSGAEDKAHGIGSGEERGAFLLGHTSADTNDRRSLLLLEDTDTAHNLLDRTFANRTCVEDHQIGRRCVGR